MLKLRADLHIHTHCSDGALSPGEVVKTAKKNGVDFIAVTDHDCTLGFNEAASYCLKEGIKTVSGIEVSAYVADVKIHTLGYGMDIRCPEFTEFEGMLYNGSFTRAEDIVFRLNKNGVKITLEEIANRRAHKNSPVHAMHIAFACAEKGYCKGDPFKFYAEYLAWGKCAYSNMCRPSPEDTVRIIADCGGFSSLAHPARIDMPRDSLVALVKKLKSCALGGIEAVYTTHTVTETAYYKEMAKTFSLIVTGGSDTHYLGGRYDIGAPEYYLDEALAKRFGI